VTDPDVAPRTDDGGTAAGERSAVWRRATVWRSGFAFWSSSADAPRVRRPSDAAVAVIGLVAIGLLAISAPGPTDSDSQIAEAIASLPGLLGWFWEAAYAATLLWAIVLMGAALVTRHRRVLLLEQLAAAVLAVVVGGTIAVLEGSTWSQVWASLLSHDSSTVYPALRFTLVVAVIAVTSPHIARPQRRLGGWVVALGALGGLALGIDTVLGLLAGLALGVTVAALVHLVAGSPGGHAPIEQLRDELADLGVEVEDLDYVEDAAGVTARGTDATGRRLLVRVYGRDAWEASLFASVWQRLWYRQAGSVSGVGRQQQAEHEAFLTLLAERAGVPVQPVVTAGTVWGRDAILVRHDDGVRFDLLEPGAIGTPQVEAAWRALDALHLAGMAHGAITAGSLVLADDGQVLLTDLEAGVDAAAEAERATDIAQMLVTTALAVGVEESVRIAAAQLGDERLVTSLPYLQTAAFDTEVRKAIKAADWKVAALRESVAAATGTEQPPLEKLRRVSLSQIAMLVVLIVVAYTIIGAIAGVGLDTLVEQFQGASWWWVGAAVLLAVGIYFGQAIAMQGAAVDRLPFVPVLGLEMSIAFVGLAVPSSAAKIGMTIRFLQLVGSNPTAAVTISLLDSFSGFLVQALVIVLTLFTGVVTLTPANTSGTGIGSTLENVDWAAVGVIALVLLVLAILVIRFVPKVRRFVVDRTAEGRESLQVLRSPRKLVQIAFGSVLWNVVAAVVLGASLNAFGHSATFAELILINTLVALFSGLMPVPGNVGVAEAALTAGLVAIGIPQPVAMSTAIVYRLATYFVPAIYGYVSLQLMRRRGYL
jgi:uncharacterized membrane protein YbhN (UPF0104 family)